MAVTHTVLLQKQILSLNSFYRLKLISQKGGSMWQPQEVSTVAHRDLKLRMLPFCPTSFYWRLLLAPAVLPWDCLKGSVGGSSDCSSGLILGWLMLLWASLQGKRWFTLPWTAREDCEGLTSWSVSCWTHCNSRAVERSLPRHFISIPRLQRPLAHNTWLETHHYWASTVEQSHKLVVWRPPHSSEAVRWGVLRNCRAQVMAHGAGRMLLNDRVYCSDVPDQLSISAS